MRLLVIDTETGGLDPKTDPLLEVAAALYHTECRAASWHYSTLVGAVGENGAEHINGISAGLRDAHEAIGLRDCDHPVPAPIAEACRHADAVVAHNAQFDQSFIDERWAALRADGGRALPWVCTQQDIVWPKAHNFSRHLAHLAVDHGIVMAGQQHRAMADVLLLVELLSKVPDLEAQIQIALKPRGIFEALVPYADRELAKEAGFRWDGSGDDAGRRCWWTKLPLDVVQDAHDGRPFAVRLVREL